MTLLLDAAPLVALGNRRDRDHTPVHEALKAWRGPLVIPAPVTAEIDYLLGRRLGRASRLAFIQDVAHRRFTILALDPEEYETVLELERRYAGLDLGLADASLVVLARRLDTRAIATFDERHFRAVEPLQGGAFELIPADLV
jgi:uncharacterized protein